MKNNDRNEPKLLSDASPGTFSGAKAIFFDIDDTFSGGRNQPRITQEAYEALWKLHDAGFKAIPVTGRPAGWCDMIARMWPVTAVVGENGAFYAYMEQGKSSAKLVKKYLESPRVRAENALKLKKLHAAVLKKFPGARTPSDQPFREFDLAIDYCEDVKRWPDAKVQALLTYCRNSGAIAKLSSIHVNAWFGRYDKLTCVRRMLSHFFQLEIPDIVYIGDSPNDEPFFEKVPLSVGVANVEEFLDGGKMQHAPAFITRAKSGLGFAELAHVLLRDKVL